jgi:hypothetical protein
MPEKARPRRLDNRSFMSAAWRQAIDTLRRPLPSPFRQARELPERVREAADRGARQIGACSCTGTVGAGWRDRKLGRRSARGSTVSATRQAADPRLAAHQTARRRVLPHLFRQQQPRADLERTLEGAGEKTRQHPPHREKLKQKLR